MKGHVITPQRARLDHFFFARPTIDPPLLDAAVPHPDLSERARRVRGATFVPPPVVSRQRPRPTPASAPTPGAALSALQRPLAVLHAPLVDACHDAALAPLAILAVLSAEGATPEADARRAILSAGLEPEAVLALASGVRPGADLLPAIEVAMPALRSLDADDRQRLFAAAKALVEADQQTTLAEHAILQMLRTGLRAPDAGRLLGAELARASDVLFGVLALAGSSDPREQARAAGAGRAALRAQMRLPHTPEASGAILDRLGPALDALRRASTVQRHAVLDAAHAVVIADGRTLRDEAALLRATALALGVACVVHPEPLAEAEGTSREWAGAKVVA